MIQPDDGFGTQVESTTYSSGDRERTRETERGLMLPHASPGNSDRLHPERTRKRGRETETERDKEGDRERERDRERHAKIRAGISISNAFLHNIFHSPTVMKLNLKR